jgi:hypothetical protein
MEAFPKRHIGGMVSQYGPSYVIHQIQTTRKLGEIIPVDIPSQYKSYVEGEGATWENQSIAIYIPQI